MDYQTVSHFAQTAGLVFLVGLFTIVLGYVFWPRNRERFRQAAQLPLEEE